MDKLPTFKHTIDVPELLKEVIVERITKRKAFNERRSDRTYLQFLLTTPIL